MTNKITDCMWRLLYPPRCPVCDEALPFGLEAGMSFSATVSGVCPACRARLRTVGEHYCIKCGKPLHEEQIMRCHDCTVQAHSFTRGRSLFYYEDIRESLYRFKYGGRREYASFYAAEVAGVLGEDIRSWHAQALIPVPLHRAKQKKRGYNQAALLARALSAYLHIPVREDLMIRTRNTAPQKTLDHAQRQKNLKKAFKIVQNDVKLKTAILIDDIYTTGSTMDAMGSLFMQAGVSNIYFITLASGSGV